MRLSQSNPELFENPTLGEASPTRFLDEVELQKIEDRQARIDKREPAIARREVRYPTMTPSHSVPSSIKDEVKLISPDKESFDSEFPVNLDDLED